MKNFLNFSTIFKKVLCGVLFSNPFQCAFAQETVPLREKEPAPFSGVLFSNEEANKVRREKLELQQTKKINESLVNSLKLSETIDNVNREKVNLVVSQMDILSKNLQEERNVNNWERAVWIGVGILAAGVGALALKGASR